MYDLPSLAANGIDQSDPKAEEVRRSATLNVDVLSSSLS